ncbi:unnamed protein product, partial [Rotaria sp. Silwood2]
HLQHPSILPLQQYHPRRVRSISNLL